MNILVTGASGFIGSNLLQELVSVRNQDKVYALSRRPIEVNSDNLIVILCDLATADFVNDLPSSIDTVIHLSQSKMYREFPEKALDIFDVNIRATQLLLDWARRTSVSKFIFASTGNVYGSSSFALTENSECSPKDYYGKSKYAAELLISSYNSFFSVSIFRLFGVYGPGQSDMIIPNIINKIKSNAEVTLAENKGLIFTPLYITDCVRMILATVGEKAVTEDLEVYNLAGNETISLSNVVSLVSKYLFIEPYIRLTNDKPMCFIGDSKKFVNKFSFVYTTTFEAGLQKTIQGIF